MSWANETLALPPRLLVDSGLPLPETRSSTAATPLSEKMAVPVKKSRALPVPTKAVDSPESS